MVQGCAARKLARGVNPDFVVSVDTQEMTFTKYEGVDIPDDVA